MKIKNILSALLITLTLTSFSFANSLVSGINNENFGPISSGRVGCFMFTQDLKLGDGLRGVDKRVIRLTADSKAMKVLELQNALISAGYMSGESTLYFGPKTLKAVKSFQRDNNIKTTGYVGEKTKGILRSKFCNLSNTGDNPAVCSYANPPVGCDYINGPDYNATTGCGMVLKCAIAPIENKIKDCPSEKIINMMPVMCIRAPCPPIDNSYYIYKGARKEISDFDSNYVKNSCSVKETIVQ